MPYYHAFIEGPFVPSEEEIVGIVHDRPISFKEKLEFGPRRLLVGHSPLIVDIMSHDEAVIRATRDVTVVVESHDGNPDDDVVIDQARVPALLGTAENEKFDLNDVLLHQNPTSRSVPAAETSGQNVQSARSDASGSIRMT